MKSFFLTLLSAFLVFGSLSAKSYEFDHASFDQALEASEDITAQFEMLVNPYKMGPAPQMTMDEKTAQTAAIIAFVATGIRWFGGIIAIVPVIGYFIALGVWVAAIVPWHRLYLGTGGEDVKIIALYCVTLGWCINAHHIVDGIMLLVNDDQNYFDNPKWVMWAN